MSYEILVTVKRLHVKMKRSHLIWPSVNLPTSESTKEIDKFFITRDSSKAHANCKKLLSSWGTKMQK